MRPKEHPELIFDVIPKLYEKHSKVFVTHLGNVKEQLIVLPRKFCRMYTTRPLADQFRKYLLSRQAKISDEDFQVVEEGQPFPLNLSDGKRLEAMLCRGSKLGHNLILLIRRPKNASKLLYCYSAVRLENLGSLLGNSIFNSWIAHGTEQLYLNLSSVNQPFVHVDFDEVAATIDEYRKKHNAVVLLRLPLFGYEEFVWQLGYTRLHGHIRLLGDYEESFQCLSPNLKPIQGRVTKVHVCAPNWTTEANQVEMEEAVSTVHFPLGFLKWSPLPTRMHLRQLCSLLRPQQIQGIVPYHSVGNVPPAPQFLQCFRSTYFAANKEVEPSTSKAKGAKADPPVQKGKEQAPLRVINAKRFEFVDDDSD